MDSALPPTGTEPSWLRAALRLVIPALRRLARNRSFTVGAALVLLVLMVACFANLLAPYDPLRSNFRVRLVPPSAEHWFGTDHFGRDLLSRVIYGGRVSMEIGLLVVLATGLFGTTIGAIAGYFSALDNVLMRLMDALMAFPTILVAREMQYVEAARALGASDVRLLFGHVLINSLAPLIVRLTYVFAIAILAEAVLSYIGVGPPPPTPTFGNIIAGERDFITTAPWAMIFPGLAIVVAVLGLNLLGDGLRDALDPRMRM